MAIIVNKSAAQLSAATKIVWNETNKETGRKTIKRPGKMYDFVPGIITTVPDADWKQLKEIRLIKESLDNGVLVMGKAASKVADDAKKETKAAEEKDGVKSDRGSDDSDDDLLD